MQGLALIDLSTSVKAQIRAILADEALKNPVSPPKSFQSIAAASVTPQPTSNATINKMASKAASITSAVVRAKKRPSAVRTSSSKRSTAVESFLVDLAGGLEKVLGALRRRQVGDAEDLRGGRGPDVSWDGYRQIDKCCILEFEYVWSLHPPSCPSLSGLRPGLPPAAPAAVELGMACTLHRRNRL